jgi:hypothetical protein
MYVFGFDIPLNIVMAVGLALHLVEFVLAVLIVRKVRRRHA